MEIVIKLTEDDYKKVQDGRAPVTVMRNAIRNGTPLPKGHGALKDVDKIEEAFWDNDLIDTNMDSLDNGESNKMRRAMIRTMHLDVPTMVEADEGCGDDCEHCEWATCPKMEADE